MTTLRPYQSAAVAAVRAHWSAGRRRVLVALPTGAGKTVVATAALAGARAPLALVHTRTLLEQTARRLGPGVRVMTIQAALASGASLASFDRVFIDECHHLASARWVRVLRLLSPTALIIGCTATPQRADGAALGHGGAGFDALVATAPYSALLAAGHLAPARVIDAARLRGNPAAAYLALGQRRPGIMFATTMAACNAAVMALGAAGVRAAVITAKTPAAMRVWAFAAFERGDLDVLVSPMALAEGFDSPRAAVCVLDRQCEHVGTYLQMAGRVLRPHPTKGPAAPGRAPALVIDCRGAAARHGSPTDDRSYSLTGTAIAPAVSARRPTTRPAAPAAAIVGAGLRSAWQWVRAALQAA